MQLRMGWCYVGTSTGGFWEGSFFVRSWTWRGRGVRAGRATSAGRPGQGDPTMDEPGKPLRSIVARGWPDEGILGRGKGRGQGQASPLHF
jgi:hypothetical protein